MGRGKAQVSENISLPALSRRIKKQKTSRSDSLIKISKLLAVIEKAGVHADKL